MEGGFVFNGNATEHVALKFRALDVRLGEADPSADEKFDASVVPVGGPYPEVREFEDEVPEEEDPPEPEVKTVYVESPRPPEPFPYWFLHRKR